MPDQPRAIYESNACISLRYCGTNAGAHTCRDPGSNRGPSDLQSDALPTELSRQLHSRCTKLYIWPNELSYLLEPLHPTCQDASNCKFARVVKGVDLRSTAGNCAWARTPQLARNCHAQMAPRCVFTAYTLSAAEICVAWCISTNRSSERPCVPLSSPSSLADRHLSLDGMWCHGMNQPHEEPG